MFPCFNYRIVILSISVVPRPTESRYPTQLWFRLSVQTGTVRMTTRGLFQLLDTRADSDIMCLLLLSSD